MSYTSLFLFFTVLLSVHASSDSFLVMRGQSHEISTLNEQNVADLLAHVNGLEPLNQQTNREQFPHTNLFETPAVNVLVALDSVTTDLLNSARTSFLNVANDRAINVVKATYPEDSLTTLTTMLTGDDHLSHGIVGHSWKASRDVSVEAFSKNGNCLSPKITDQIAVASNGKARVVSVSGSKKMTAAFGVNTEIMEQHSDWNCESLYFHRQKGLVNMYNDNIEQSFKIIVSDATNRGMTLQSLEGYVLATELYAISKIPIQLVGMQKGDVEIPDFIGIGISSIRDLTLKYGEGSVQVLDAIRLFDIELIKLFAKLEDFYAGAGKINVQIVGLQSSTEEHTFYTQRKQQIRLVDDDPIDNGGNNNNNQTSGTYTQDDVSAFQTQFWVSIVLIIAFILSTITLCKMDMLENSLIYRTTDGPRPIPDVQ